MAIDSYTTRTKFVEISKVVISGILRYDPEDKQEGWHFEDNGKLYGLDEWMIRFDSFPSKRVRVTIELVDESDDNRLLEGDHVR